MDYFKKNVTSFFFSIFFFLKKKEHFVNVFLSFYRDFSIVKKFVSPGDIMMVGADDLLWLR